MLKNIPAILSPALLKVLMEMGHADEIVIADGNFPAESMGQRVVRLDGHGVPEILDAIMQFFPLDQYDDGHAVLMEVVPGDTVETPIWDEYRKILKKRDSGFAGLTNIERFSFYDRTKSAYAVIATGETALYANIILKKGVVKD
jgi:L-fucose mutarotase